MEMKWDFINIFISHHVKRGARGGAMVEALLYKPEGRGINSQWFQMEFFIDIILPAALWP
jgi:hypothetical protein